MPGLRASTRLIFTRWRICATRAHLERQDGGALREEEKEAIHQIDEARGEIKRASIDDGKDQNDHPPVDAGMDRTGRLHRAKEGLERARQDISHEEDNGFAQGPQQRAFGHIDRALHEVNEAIRLVASRDWNAIVFLSAPLRSASRCIFSRETTNDEAAPTNFVAERKNAQLERRMR
jgi:hypothetical protein